MAEVRTFVWRREEDLAYFTGEYAGGLPVVTPRISKAHHYNDRELRIPPANGTWRLYKVFVRVTYRVTWHDRTYRTDLWEGFEDHVEAQRRFVFHKKQRSKRVRFKTSRYYRFRPCKLRT